MSTMIHRSRLLGAVALMLMASAEQIPAQEEVVQESISIESFLNSFSQETDHFFFGSLYGSYQEIVEQSDELYRYVVDRVGVPLEYQVSVTFVPPEADLCPARGITTGTAARGRTILIYADDVTSQAQLLGVLAHELGHVIHYSAIDGDILLTPIFGEGFATWIAGRYWLDWQGVPSFQSAVRSYIDSGTYLPLHENDVSLATVGEEGELQFGQDCLKVRDIIYTEWAAFIDYLVDEHGLEKLLELFHAPPMEAAPDQPTFIRLPNFPEVYGASLEQLEVAWLQSLDIGN